MLIPRIHSYHNIHLKTYLQDQTLSFHTPPRQPLKTLINVQLASTPQDPPTHQPFINIITDNTSLPLSTTPQAPHQYLNAPTDSSRFPTNITSHQPPNTSHQTSPLLKSLILLSTISLPLSLVFFSFSILIFSLPSAVSDGKGAGNGERERRRLGRSRVSSSTTSTDS